MSRATNFPEQDVGGGEDDSLPTYENLAEAHGPNSRYAIPTFGPMAHRIQCFSLVVQVRQVEKLGREEVISPFFPVFD
jgi:hypothetical protein